MSRSKWNRERLLVALRDSARELGRVPEVHGFTTSHGVSNATVVRWWGSWPAFVEAAGLTGDPAVTERQRDNARRDRRNSEQLIAALKREAGEQRARAGLFDAIAAAPEPPPLRLTAKRKRAPKQEAAYVMLASDWHMGERVRPEGVGGRNEYRPEIAQERAAAFFRRQLKMMDAARSAWTVDDAVLWLGGDLMTGYIHEEYEEDNFLSPVEEALLVHATLVQGIDALLARGGLRRLLVPTSCGNHGRTGRKVRVSTYAKNSYEWMLYQLLARHYAAEPRVEFRVASGYHNVVDLYGFKIRFHHGDALKYGGGIGGLGIPLHRRMGRQAQAGEHVHLDAIGHFHQFQGGLGYVVNGSLIGWNAYAEWLGVRYEEPMQTSFVIDSRYRLVSNFNPIMVRP